MPREHSQEQYNRLLSRSTKPVYVAEINHSGTVEYLSASGDVVFNGQAYTGGGFDLNGFVNSESAQISLNATPERVGEILAGTYRRGVCKIWAIPGLDSDTGDYSGTLGWLVLSGIIDTSTQNGKSKVVVNVVNKYLTGRTGPGYLFNQICNYMPAPGSSITWEDEIKPVKTPEETTKQPGVNPPLVLW